MFCRYCGERISETVNNHVEEEITDVETEICESDNAGEIQQPELSQPKKFLDKKKMIILGLIVIVAVVGIGFGVKSYMDNKAREEYINQYNQYVDDIGTLNIKMLSDGAAAEDVCNLTLKVWSNAIWKTSDSKTDKYTKSNGTFVSDFNDALINLTKDKEVMTKRVALSSAIDDTAEKMEKMKNPPKDLEDKYGVLKEMFDVYQDFLNTAVTPSGSYTSYNSNLSDYSSELVKLYKKVDAFDLTHITQ